MKTILKKHVFDYQVEATKTRSRRPERWIVRETFEANIPGYDASDISARVDSILLEDPRAVIVDDTYFIPVQSSELRFTDDRLDRFVTNSSETRCKYRSPYTLTLATRAAAQWGSEHPFKFAGDGSELRDVVESDRDRRRKLASRDVEHLCMIGDVLYTSRFQPVLTSATPSKTYPFSWSWLLKDVFDVERSHWDKLVYDPTTFDRRFPGESFPRREVIEQLVGTKELRGTFPTLHQNLRVLLAQASLSVFRPNRQTPHLGSGSFAMPDVPEDLDEAVFDVRRSLRDIDVDLRGATPSNEVYELATERLAAFVEIYERELPLHNNFPKDKTQSFASDLRYFVEWRRREGLPTGMTP